MRWHWTVDDGLRPAFPVGAEFVVAEFDAGTPLEGVAAQLGVSTSALTDPVSTPDRPVPRPSGVALSHRVRPAMALGFGLHFRGGPLGGQFMPLEATQVLLGRAATCGVVILDPHLAPEHLDVDARDRDAVRIAPIGAAVVLVNGVALGPGGCILGAGDVIEIGASVVSIEELVLPAGDLGRDGEGALAFNRPSRIRARRLRHRVTLPGPRPEEPRSAPMPWFAALIPLLAAAALTWFTRQPLMLVMAAAGPFMVFASNRSQRRQSLARGRQADLAWRRRHAQAVERLAEISRNERVTAWSTALDPALAREMCRVRAASLWERRRDDSDALTVRLGLAQLPVPVDVDGGSPDDSPVEPCMSPVPVTVDLRAVGVLGIAGLSGGRHAVARWVMLQLAITRSPRDLRLVLLCDERAAAEWEWVRWLPQLRVEAAGAPTAMIGNSDPTRLARVTELSAIVESRMARLAGDRGAGFTEEIVLLLDNARDYLMIPGLTRVLRDGPSVGVRTVCLEGDRTRLPQEVTAELVLADDSPVGFLSVADRPTVPRVLVDGVSADLAEDCARRLTPLVHVGGDGDETRLPSSIRLVDLLELDLDDPAPIAARWRNVRPSTSTVVGVATDGPLELDLRVDGPHGLVAGTTGAGKSELLQTLVVGLALANRPEALTFLLVDYKGASAFADCARLPHTAGMVTNLDNRETHRALTALDAELKRRESALRILGARDIDDAWQRDPEGAAAARLPRLVLVIDEFAELVHELPQFVTGLIRIARVGRSLGIHLILATQRPGGVVSAEMQANLSLRIGLRLLDKSDSSEVIAAPDAAFVPASTPGRGFVRRGAGVTPDGFQAARVAGVRPGDAAASSCVRAHVRTVPWVELGEPLVFAGGDGPPTDPRATDLAALVDVIGRAATLVGSAPAASPWLPPLPTVITTAELERRFGPSDAGVLLGLLDRPDEQAQIPLRYQPTDGSHLLVAGSARSGRSSVCRTLLAALSATYSPDDLHVYALDFGTGALLPAARLPHCGAAVSVTEPDRVNRLLGRLGVELRRRQQVLSDGGFGDINEQRAAGRTGRLPYIVVVLDRWEGLLAAFPIEQVQVLRDRITRILREGPAVGVSMVISGDRAVISDRIAAHVDTRYTLRLSDREDYRLVGVRPSDLPERIDAGRAYFGDPMVELQFAVLTDDPSGQAQTVRFQQVIEDSRTRYCGPGIARPFRVDALPTRISADEANRLPPADGGPDDFAVTAGVGGDDLVRYGLDFSQASGALVSGPRRCGRSTALAGYAGQFTARSIATAVVATKDSPLTVAAEGLGLPRFEALDARSADALIDWIARHSRCVVVVDDAETVHGTAVDSALIETARVRDSGSFAVVVSALLAPELASLLRGVAVEARRHRQGILLSPASSLDGNVFGVAVDRALIGHGPPGRGLMLVDGEWQPIQIPIHDGAFVAGSELARIAG